MQVFSKEFVTQSFSKEVSLMMKVTLVWA